MPASHGDKVREGTILTRLLRDSLREVVDVAPDGTQITRAEHRRNILNRLADGYVETVKDDNGKVTKIKHPPVAWAIQYCMDRTDGKVAQAAPEVNEGIKAADKVRQLAKDRVNSLVKSAPKPAGPPNFKRT